MSFNPVRWVREWIGFLGFLREMLKRDEKGKRSGFLYSSDDASVKDYLERRPFARNVFISFERQSLGLAERFEHCLRLAGLTPWRYEPEHQDDITLKSTVSLAEQIEVYRERNPNEIARLTATVRRCAAVLFLVSPTSLSSGFCELEAMIAGTIHRYGAEENAAVYVILETADLSPPAFLSKFWKRVYEPGLEEDMAILILSEIDAQAAKLELIEEHRSKVFR